MSTHDAETACPGAVATRVFGQALVGGNAAGWTGHTAAAITPSYESIPVRTGWIASQAGCPTLVDV